MPEEDQRDGCLRRNGQVGLKASWPVRHLLTIFYSLALQLAVPHNDEWTRFARTLVEIRANRADSEEEGIVELSA